MSQEKKQEKKYVEIGQYSIGRLSFKDTPENIEGLYVTREQSSLIVIIHGTQGVTLIHDIETLLPQSLADQFKGLGEIIRWTVIYNRLFSQKNTDADCCIKVKDFFGALKKCAPLKDLQKKIATPIWRETSSCTISVDREGRIATSEFSPEQLVSLTPQEKEKRLFINFFNAYFTLYDASANDIQFDGTRVTPCPLLQMSPREMYDALTSEVTASAEHMKEIRKPLYARRSLRYFLWKHEPAVYKAIEKEKAEKSAEKELSHKKLYLIPPEDATPEDERLLLESLEDLGLYCEIAEDSDSSSSSSPIFIPLAVAKQRK